MNIKCVLIIEYKMCVLIIEYKMCVLIIKYKMCVLINEYKIFSATFANYYTTSLWLVHRGIE